MLHTPLHLAILKGHSIIVERLVSCGADLTAVDLDGNTPLHLVLASGEMELLSADTPLLNKVSYTSTLHLSTACMIVYNTITLSI